jgi:alkyl sulfatase BDS1-like metallo-beta-lactamase superfamily hydrolase
MFLDYTGVRLNSDKAAGKKIDMILELTDTKQKYEVGVVNSVLHYSDLSSPSRLNGQKVRRAVANPDVIYTTTREAFNDVMMGTKTYNQLVTEGKATLGGANPAKLNEFASWLDTFGFVRILL